MNRCGGFGGLVQEVSLLETVCIWGAESCTRITKLSVSESRSWGMGYEVVESRSQKGYGLKWHSSGAGSADEREGGRSTTFPALLRNTTTIRREEETTLAGLAVRTQECLESEQWKSVRQMSTVSRWPRRKATIDT